MKTGKKGKTAARHSGGATSQAAEPNKILGNEDVAAVETAVAKAAEPVEVQVGRPKGARNRRSDALRELQATRYGMTVGELLTATLFDGLTDHLAKGKGAGGFLEERARVMASRLSIDPGKALEHVKAMADDLMPYVHQKLPMAVEIDQRGIMVAVVTPDGGFASPTGGAAIDLRPAQARLGAAIEGDFGVKSDGQRRTDDE